jgi:predicted amidohydrolase YtcJ
MAVVVEGGVIQEINSYAEIVAQPDAIICDCSGLFLVHGLVDALNHLSLDFHLP